MLLEILNITLTINILICVINFLPNSYSDAADRGIAKALKAGCRAPLLLFSNKDSKRFPEAGLVSVLGAMKCLYVPLEMREARAERATKVDKLGVFGNKAHVEEKLTLAKALEAGRVVCRDIGGSDPERMASPRLGIFLEDPKKS